MKKILFFQLIGLIFLTCIGCSGGTKKAPYNGPEYLRINFAPLTLDFSNNYDFDIALAGHNKDDQVRIKIVFTNEQQGCSIIYVWPEPPQSFGTNTFDNHVISINTNIFNSNCRYSGSYKVQAYFIKISNGLEKVTSENTKTIITTGGGGIGGGGNNNPITVKVERAKMSNTGNDFTPNTATQTCQSTLNTFRNPAYDSKVNINYSQSTYIPTGENFNFSSEEEEALTINLRDFSNFYRQLDTNDYPYHLIYANELIFPNDEDLLNRKNFLGISNSLYSNELIYRDHLRNYSYIFTGNIRYKFPTTSPYNYNQQSVYNFVTAHELLHQLGSVFDDLAHENHQPPNFECVLRNSIWFTAYTSYFNVLTSMYKICQTHIDILRNHNDNFAYNFLPISGGAIEKEGNPQIELNISTSKHGFKKYEPILILFNYINHYSYNDTVYYAFNDHLDVMKFRIEDEKGKIYSKKNYLLSLTPSNFFEYVVAPGDTLKVPVSLNNFGKPIKDKSESFFNQWGYLPVGKYKVTAFLETDGPKIFNPALESNTVEIEVTELNSEDKLLLDLYKKRFDELVLFLSNPTSHNNYLENINYAKEKFNSNPFKEHILYKHLKSIVAKYHDNSSKEYLIINAYKSFLNNFSNSFYTLDRTFIFWYLTKGNFNGRNNIGYLTSRVAEVRQKFPDTPLSRYLSGSVITEYIERLSRYEE